MLFTSPVFLVFFAIVFALFSLPLGWRVKKLVLLVASYVFYAAWNPPYILLLWFSTLFDYAVGLFLERTEAPVRRKLLLISSVVVNLGVLGAFKYADFLRESTVAICAGFGWTLELAPFSLLLPVGISFYTFQSMSYTIDVYRREIPACRNLLDFSLFISFFPQLVAGPIVRASELLPQLATPRKAEPRHISWGAMLFILGLFKKVFLADAIFAKVANAAFDVAATPGSLEALVGTYAFAGQIYCDFSGYSDMAIGLGMAMGFAFPDNFRAPYAAAGFSDFWRRWHMSLSRWLRDYLYIPLGGNRRGPLRATINLALTMLLGGLWHGANWTFVVWGGLHGVLLGAQRALHGFGIEALLVKSRLARWVAMLLTFHVVCALWVLFRATSLSHSLNIYKAILGIADATQIARVTRWDLAVCATAMASIVVVQMILRGRRLESVAARVPVWLLVVLCAIMLFLAITSGGAGGDFIYFAF
jgi:alginate O-acetyltransferase complex protein AlgI